MLRGSREGKEESSFLKERSKELFYLAHAGRSMRTHKSKKFFGSFFQKRTLT
jgi:hypothetical protein